MSGAGNETGWASSGTAETEHGSSAARDGDGFEPQACSRASLRVEAATVVIASLKAPSVGSWRVRVDEWSVSPGIA